MESKPMFSDREALAFLIDLYSHRLSALGNKNFNDMNSFLDLVVFVLV